MNTTFIARPVRQTSHVHMRGKITAKATLSLKLTRNLVRYKNLTDLCRIECQPLRFFRNCYEFRVKITVLRSTVYLLQISDYCRPGTVPHLNIIVII